MEPNIAESQDAGNSGRQKSEDKIDFSRYGPPTLISLPDYDWSLWAGEEPKGENRQD